MSNSFSEKIAILRPLLIFLIVTTHVQGNLYRIDLRDVPLQVDNFFHALLSGVVAASALPLLSIISGYLAGYSFTRKSYTGNIKTKVERIIVPMLVWNFFAVVYVLWLQGKGLPSRTDIPLVSGGVEVWFYALTGFNRLPANPPLYFLRELFLCFLLVPLFMRLVNSRLLFAVYFAFVTFLSLGEINFGFFHRVDIYAFFVLGLFLFRQQELVARLGFYQRAPFQLAWLGLFAFLACLLAFYGFQEQPDHFLKLRKGLTLVGPLAFWIISGHIKGRCKQLMLWLSPASFMVFLGHVPFLNLYWNGWIAAWGKSPLHNGYALYWLSAMVFCALTMLVLRKLWLLYLASQCRKFSAGRA